MANARLNSRIDEIQRLANIAELQEYVKNICLVDEDLYLDYKAEIKTDAEEVRKIICGFANAKGGILIIGIDDKSRKVIGIGQSQGILTSLSQILGAVSPKLPDENILVFRTFPLENNLQYVYCISIQPSLSKYKPHVSSKTGRIYIRNPGETNFLKCGEEIKKRFFLDYFEANHVEQVEYELEQLRKQAGALAPTSVLYISRLKFSLAETKKEYESQKQEIDDLCSLLDEIIYILYNIDKEQNYIPVAGLPLTTPSFYNGRKDLVDKIDKFIPIYRRVYG
jgi:predicted HTH transcriptional regulator